MTEIKLENLPENIKLFPGLTERVFFQNPETKEFWFHATSVCETLGFKNVTSALGLHCDDDEKFQEIWNGKATWFVSEAGCYGLAMGAKNEVAKKFKRWLKHDVLVKLRADGFYIARRDEETISKLQAEIDAIRWELEGERQEREHLEMLNDDLKHTNKLLGNQDKLKKQVFEYLKLHIIHKPGKYADSGEVLYNFNRKYKLDVEETIFDTWADEFFKIFYSKETDAPYVNREDIAHFYENCVVLTKCNRINQYRLG